MNEALEIMGSEEPQAKNDTVHQYVHQYGEGETVFTVDYETYGLTKKAVNLQSAVANRWIAAEPRISASFGASKDDEGTPINSDCYTDGTAAHKALVQFLREVHPLASKYDAQVLAAKGAKAGGADPATQDDLETRRNLTANKIKADTANGMRALKDAFIKNKQGEKGDRAIKSPRDVLAECSLRLGKFADAKGTPQADKDMASKFKQILDGMLSSPDNLTTIWESVPLAPVAARITKDYTQPGKAVDVTAEYLAQQLAEAVHAE